MPYCVECGKSQARLSNGSLCKSCFNVKSNFGNNSFDTLRNTSSNVDGMNEYYDAHNITSRQNELCDMNKPVAELSANQLMLMIKVQLEPLENKIDDIEKSLKQKVVSLEKKVIILENEIEKQNEKNEVLTSTIVNMQKALNSIDSQERSKIVLGLTENEINVNNVIKRTGSRKNI